MVARVLLCLLLLLLLVRWPHASSVNCSMPALTIGIRLNSSKDLTRFVKRHQYALIGFSAASCSSCCWWEPLYKTLTQALIPKVHWARVDMDRLEAKPLATTHDIEALPAVVFFNRRKPNRFKELHSFYALKAFVERSLSPLPTIHGGSAALSESLELKEAFQPFSSSFPGENPDRLYQVVRISAVLDDHTDEDQEELIETARVFANKPSSFQFSKYSATSVRQDLAKHPLPSVDCANLVRSGRPLLVASALFDGEFVESGRIADVSGGPTMAGPKISARGIILNASMAVNSDSEDRFVILPRIACQALDSYDGISIEQWVLRSSLPPVGRFDTFTSSLYEKTMKPLLMLFADTRRPELTHWLSLLYDAHKRYNRPDDAIKDGYRICFVYIDGLMYSHRMPSLGLAANPKRLPALSFNYVTEQLITWQPPVEAYQNGSAVLNARVVDSLVQRYFGGERAQKKEKTPPKSLPVPKRNVARGEQRNVPDLEPLTLEERLRFVVAINMRTFSDVVYDTAKDVMVFFFASKGVAAAASKKRAIYVNRCAERFEELGISTLRVVRLDMSLFSAPASVQISEVPSLAFFPAFAKDPPYPIFSDDFKVQQIMWWCQDHASRKFKLPEVPHLDEIEAEAYWQQKSEQSAERQFKIAVENEGRARRKYKTQRQNSKAHAKREL